MIRDLLEDSSASSESGKKADICIVGAGAAGILLAVELCRRNKRIILLEGGGSDIELASQEPYQSEIAGQKHLGVHTGRFRACGGSTTRWGGQILELDNVDFGQRSWIEGSGWPIRKRDLAPYYARAIELEGLSNSTLDDNAVWGEVGLQTPQFQGVDAFFSRWCPETNFARLHHATLADHPLITVWLHANAIAPVWEGSRIRGIRARTLTGIEGLLYADTFIWTMGGIESSRFFLQPELARLPWNRSGLLGRHFQDHVGCSAARLELIDPQRFHRVFDNIFTRGYKYQPKFRLQRNLQEENETLNVGAMIVFQSDSNEIGTELKGVAKKLLRRPLSDSTLAEGMRLVRHAPLFARQIWRYAVAHRAYIPPDATIELGVTCEQPPLSKSSITLSDQRDSLGLLRTRIDWKVTNHEIDSIRTIIKVASDALRAVARVIPDPDLTDYDRFRDKCGDSNHHMGGMRMGSSADRSVVDLDLKLHGIDNGYVCSGAVFPSSGFSNPTHTILALAVRLAEHLGNQ